jgi:Protein of unknown function (DUF669)
MGGNPPGFEITKVLQAKGTSMQRTSFDSILPNDDAFNKMFDDAEASSGFDPLPSGTYRCLVAKGEMIVSKEKRTPGFQITFEVIGGEFSRRKIWHTVWMTAKSVSIAKAELAKLGIATSAQLKQPLPPGMIAVVKVVVHADDDGETRNSVKRFEIVKGEAEPDDFAPVAPTAPTPGGNSGARQREPGDDDDFDWETGEYGKAVA